MNIQNSFNSDEEEEDELYQDKPLHYNWIVSRLDRSLACKSKVQKLKKILIKRNNEVKQLKVLLGNLARSNSTTIDIIKLSQGTINARKLFYWGSNKFLSSGFQGGARNFKVINFFVLLIFILKKFFFCYIIKSLINLLMNVYKKNFGTVGKIINF